MVTDRGSVRESCCHACEDVGLVVLPTEAGTGERRRAEEENDSSLRYLRKLWRQHMKQESPVKEIYNLKSSIQ